MFHEGLFETALMNPARKGANRLRIVTGYATAAMASWHMHQLVESELDVTIELIVGMTPRDGIPVSDHKGFQTLVSDGFSCKYVVREPGVHSKLYIWSNFDEPLAAFAGSANYTQTAFSTQKGMGQREILVPTDPTRASAYFDATALDALHIDHKDVPELVNIYRGGARTRMIPFSGPPQLHPGLVDPPSLHAESATLSLLTSDGSEVHRRSGLNWGQREEEGREPNQAYIPVYAPLKNENFFPPRGVYFTAHTDDGVILVLTRAQDGAKAIQTPWNNSELGLYFRRRLGLPSGAFITKEHLVEYGRTDVTFHKLDDETFYMDFSVPEQPGR